MASKSTAWFAKGSKRSLAIASAPGLGRTSDGCVDPSCAVLNGIDERACPGCCSLLVERFWCIAAKVALRRPADARAACLRTILRMTAGSSLSGGSSMSSSSGSDFERVVNDGLRIGFNTITLRFPAGTFPAVEAASRTIVPGGTNGPRRRYARSACCDDG